MKAAYIDYQDTHSFSKLLLSYLDEKQDVSSFYGNKPTFEGFEKQIKTKAAFAHREVLTDTVAKQYSAMAAEDAETLRNIELLRDENTFTVTTGHQLNIFTGPLYFVFKIVSTIRLARDLKEQFPEYNFVPVYWMATEDHDFEEINHTYLFGKKINWETSASGATGRLSTTGIEDTVHQYCAMFGLSETAEELSYMVKDAYLNQGDLANATRKFVHSLFGKYGLVIIDADRPELKEIFAPYVYKDIAQKISYQQGLSSSQLLEERGYKVQVNPREINFFYLRDELRERIIEKNEVFEVLDVEDISWSLETLEKEILKHPSHFSPNVLTRPLYQEVILPNLAYIGGGAEIAYWLQLKSTFTAHHVDFPILIPRNSAMIMDAKLVSKIFRLDFTFKDIFRTAEDLHQAYVRAHTRHDLDLRDEWMEFGAVFDKIKLRAHKIDPTLGPSAEAVQARLKKAIKRLEKKLLKADKKNYKEALIQIDRLKEKLFPKQGLQERHENFAPYYLKYGEKLFEELLLHLNPLDFKFSILFSS
ncbi:MAG TPA: bacillithiol biosynthesis cysteine-adding enzyme BshC [Sphingobacterium sp.]|nr:bacillithiol biosynthesis cysteine-adding enzyme BshC [Sphingobacterium sp.]